MKNFDFSQTQGIGMFITLTSIMYQAVASHKNLVALVDCNNFFVSCERVFRPDLHHKPTVVLSNNDGCVVARSQEVKDLGVPMGIPLFKVRDVFDKHQVTTFSSNFRLYGDMSQRVMQTLGNFTNQLEVYSIDEAFVLLPNRDSAKLSDYAQKMLTTVEKHVGIPVSIGIAQTKTLAKIANEFAKKERRFHTVTNLAAYDTKKVDAILAQIPVGDVWGIGRNRTALLEKKGIFTARDLKYASPTQVKRWLSVLGERTQLELQGVQCFGLDARPTPKKGIASTRSFGTYITDYAQLFEAVADYTAKAVRKLRKQDSIARAITVYIRTNRFSKTEKPFAAARTVKLSEASDVTSTFIHAAAEALSSIFIVGKKYQKAGVYITEVVPRTDKQFELGSTPKPDQDDSVSQLMHSIDRINERYGSEVVRSAAQGAQQSWKAKSEHSSPQYTTKWEEILRVH